MMVTTNPDTIRLWAEAHGGHPEIVEDPHAGSDEPILRINFPGKQNDIFLAETPLRKKVSWEDFFKQFDAANLAFMYEEEVEGEDISLAYRLVKRNEVDTLELE